MLVGVAIGFERLGLLTVPTGVHTYVPFPLPFNVVFPPAQIVASVPALAVGNGFTVSAKVATSVHPFASVIVTV